jgi:hypothetical protein
MLDANADGADWREVSRIALHIDAERDLTGRGVRSIPSLARQMDVGVRLQTVALARLRRPVL